MQGSGKSSAYHYIVDAMLALEAKERGEDKFGKKSQPAPVPAVPVVNNTKKLKTEKPSNLINYQRVIVECTKQGLLYFHVICPLHEYFQVWRMSS